MNGLNRFNWIARSYDQAVSLIFGNTLHQAQLHFIPIIQSTDKVLVLGGGSGKFLKDLLSQCPAIEVTYIEASSEMIRLAKTNVQSNSRVSFVHGTHHQIPGIQYDVVITNFFLDLFNERDMANMVNLITNKMTDSANWLVTDFEVTRKLRHRVLLFLMYSFFRVTGTISVSRLPEWRPIFIKHGMRLKAEKFFRNGFVSASVFVRSPG